MERTIRFVMAILYVLVIDFGGQVLAQSSPAPTITDYAQSALPDTLAPDTSFCKSQTITIHGQYFKRAQGGESWDTTRVFFGGINGVQGQVLSISTSGGGTDDFMQVAIPDVFPEDTCLPMTIIKSTSLGSISFNSLVTDTVCLLGDFAQISFADTLFCIGEPNPLPVMVTSSNTTGAFCCETGASGFFVLGTGEIPLYSGSAGIDNRFEYHSNHLYCADTIQFKIDILQSIPSQATYNGLPLLTICSASTSFPVADTATLVPGFGLGHFADPTGNVFVMDSLTGMIDPAQSTPGTHDLLYIPHLPCHDTAVVVVTVNAPATAQVIYPGIAGFPPRLCQSDPVKNPAFLSGGQGGQFWSVPAGISFGQVGEILPSGCTVGTFDVMYRPLGNCSDTVLVLAGLEVDSAVASNVGFSNLSLCLSDTLNFGILPPGWCGVFWNNTQLYSGPNAVLPLTQFGLSGGEVLQIAYTRAIVCSDTDFATVNVLAIDDASFSYPNQAYCLGDADPFPILAGQGGGTYSVLTASTVNPSTGQINLTASGAGSHSIVYTTTGACPASDTVTIQIFAAASAQFGYPASTFCLGEVDPTPIISGAPGGTFTADSGLVIHPDSGTISISLSPAGTYNVTYALSGGCNTQFSQTIQIIPFDSSSNFSYSFSSYCRDGDHPVPAIFGDSAGTFYGSVSLVFSNRDSGIVDLSRTDPGIYVITLDLDNRCAIDPTDTITVLQTDNAYFNYPFLTVCEGESPLKIDSIAEPGGVFTSELSVQFSDSFGTVNLSQSIPGGPYPIHYTTNGPCPTTSQQHLTIFPRPRGGLLVSYPGGTVCSGEQVSFRAVASGASGYSFFVNGDSVDGLFDLYQSDSLRDGDTLLCVLSNSAECQDTISTLAHIAPIPESIVLERPQRLARLDPLRIKVAGLVDGTVYRWTAKPAMGPVEVYQDSGQTVSLGFGDENTFEIGFRLTRTTDPAKIEVLLTPVAGSCEGETDTVLVEILSSTQAIFVPEVFTPNGDGFNDTWIISWLPTIDPGDYEIVLYNRAGGRVARIWPLHPNWDGENLPDGVYWWKLSRRNGQTVAGQSLKIPDSDILQAGGLTIRRQ